MKQTTMDVISVKMSGRNGEKPSPAEGRRKGKYGHLSPESRQGDLGATEASDQPCAGNGISGTTEKPRRRDHLLRVRRG